MVFGDFQGTSRFEIRRRLGAGGMGVVYEAFDRDKQVAVALKTLRSPGADAILRLKQEFRALQDIQHRNLVTLGELFEEQGVWFFTMELIHGSTLLEYLRPSSRPLRTLAAVAQTDAGPLTAPTGPITPIGAPPFTPLTPLPATPAALTPSGPTGPTGANAPTAPAAPVALSARAPRPQAVSTRVAAPVYDEARLRDVLVQLTRGLMALHRAGKVHRDVKPSNILVDRDERVVLLDFGLASDAEPGPGWSDIGVVGTAAYMAPEQAVGKRVGPEADWYSVGIVLYEVLVGAVPFDGTNLQVLMDKQRSRPPHPSSRAAATPPDLDRLCAELLELDPARRPTGEAILRMLGAPETPSVTGLAPLLATRSASAITQAFVGREDELAFLAGALADTRAGRQITAYVHGESGIGKSALVRTFTTRAAADENVVVLAGRCYEREVVPYRVLDGVIDSLSRYMQRLPKHEAAALVPQRASLLLQVFPVLKRVDVLADAPRGDVLDPLELRTRVFGVLRELFARLAERRTLIVAIDDLQWADHDGFMMLAELLRPPDAPPFLLVGSWRDAYEGATDVRRRLGALPGDARLLKLLPLPQAVAVDLAEQLLAYATASGFACSDDAAGIAREAVGHPLFIDELVRSSALAPASPKPPHTERPVRLEDVLWTRIERLDPASRHVLEVVVVAATPIEQGIAAHAAGLDPATFSRHAALLRIGNLVRTTGSRTTDVVEPYHDRVRSALLSHLDPVARATRHRELARALDASGYANPLDLVEHYLGGMELEKAGQCAVQAAANATQALAFDQAARLYRLALRALPAHDAGRRDMSIALAEALANAGRGVEAARVYQSAAQGASTAEAMQLQLRAAQQLLITGHMDSGIEAMRSFLEREGIRYPRTPRIAMLSVLLRRLQLRLRGLSFRQRDESLLSPSELMRLDACYHVGLTFALVDNIRGQSFNARGLLLALRAGEPYRLARALATEGGFRAALGGRHVREGEALFVAADQLGRQVANPHALALVAATRAQTACLLGRFNEALDRCKQAERILRARCVGAHWETTAMQLWWCRALQQMGEYDRLAQRVPDLLRELKRASNQHAETNLRVTVSPFLHLTHDDPARAHAEIPEDLLGTAHQGFPVQHYYALLAEVSVDLYESRAEVAYAMVHQRWREMSQAFLFRVQFIRITMLDLRARTALALASACEPGSQRRHLVAEAARDARRLAHEHAPWSEALAELVDAGVAALSGDEATEREQLTAAIASFQTAHMGLHAAAARRRLGERLVGEEAGLLIGAADQWMARQGISNPGRMTAMLAPFGHAAAP